MIGKQDGGQELGEATASVSAGPLPEASAEPGLCGGEWGDRELEERTQPPGSHPGRDLLAILDWSTFHHLQGQGVMIPANLSTLQGH